MIRAQSWEEARKGRMVRDLPIFQGFRTNYITSPEDTRPAPQAFLIDQNPGCVLQAHFHSEPQFQVIAGGSGFVGAHPVAPFAVHYTSAHSPYGPIAAGPEGVSYFTLRAITNEGAFFMPESRGQLRRDLPNAQITVDAPELSDAAKLKSRSALAVETLIEAQDDGLAAWLMRLPPQSKAAAPRHAGGAGRFLIVAGGSMHLSGREYSRLSAAWAPAEDVDLAIGAGAGGLEVLVLQFPGYALHGQT